MNGPILRTDVAACVNEAPFVDSLAIGEKVMPAFAVKAQRGQYLKVTTGGGQLLKGEVKPRGSSSEAALITAEYTSDTYTCQRYSLKERVDRLDNAYTVAFGLEQLAEAAMRIKRNQIIAHESRVAAAIMDPTVFNCVTAATAYTEANIATIDFIKDIQDAKDRLLLKGYNPQEASMIIPQQVLSRLARSTRLQQYRSLGQIPVDNFINFTNTAGLSALAQVLEVKDILVGRIPKDTAAKGKAPNTSFVWPNSYIWIGNIGSGDFRNGGAGRTLYWDELGGLYTVKSYYSDTLDSTDVEVDAFLTEKVVDAKSAEMIATNFA